MRTSQKPFQKKSETFALSRSKNPYLLMVVLSMASSLLFFLFITGVYAVRSHNTDWHPAGIPAVFFASTILVVAISVALHIAYLEYQQEKYRKYGRYLLVAFTLGFMFVLMQVSGWIEWYSKGVLMDNSAQAAFIYILSGIHLAHVVIGMILLGIVLRDASKVRNYVEGFITSINPKKTNLLKSTVLFWHFLDCLWVYLFLFFLLV